MRRRLTRSPMGWKLRWNTGASARARADDERFTDEDILQILRAGAAGLKVADLCTAENIPVELYYRWKVEYSGVTPSELRRRRRCERRYRRTAAALAAVVVLGIGYVLIVNLSAALALQAPANPRRHSTRPPAAPVVAVSSPAPERRPQAAAPAGNASPGTSGNQPVEIGARGTRVDAEDIKTADSDGYAVQVAAVPNLQEARVVLEQLAGAGYPAYVTRKTADQVELYRVRVGPLESRRLAEEVARRLERDGHRTLWITK